MRTLKPVHPNAGIAAAYRKRLDREIETMHRSIVRHLSAAYRANPPVLAQDEAPVTTMKDAMRKLARRWRKSFDELAPKLAARFARDASERVDRSLQSMLRDAGFTVRFKMTAAQRDAYQAVIAENVGLIKSVAQKHLSDVEGLVMRSVASGRDLATLSKGLQHQFGVTRRRAALIARSQNNMATAVLTRVRQTEAGITQARWMHSAGGKTPRPSHVEAGKNRAIYDVNKGWYDPDAKQWIWPGQLINCRCVSIPVIPGLE